MAMCIAWLATGRGDREHRQSKPSLSGNTNGAYRPVGIAFTIARSISGLFLESMDGRNKRETGKFAHCVQRCVSPTKKRKLNEDFPFQSNASLHQGSNKYFWKPSSIFEKAPGN